MRFPIVCLFAWLCLNACTSNESVFSDKVTVDPIHGQDGIPKYAEAQGAGWFSCVQSPAGSYMVLLNPGPQAWSKDEACKNPAALAFLKHGWNVLSLNRPEREALGDDASLKHMKETVESLRKDNRHLDGLWSAGEGSVLGLRLARQYPWQILIVGNGIYDLEQTLKESTDAAFVARIKALPGSADPSFVEKRSAAWDLSGLPKVIYLYHGGKNSQSSTAQATQFKNSLAASEHKVELYILDEDSQDLRPEYHRGVLSKILEAFQKPE